MYNMGKAYGQTFVAFGPDSLRFQEPRSAGELLEMGREPRIHWDQIRDLNYEHNFKRRVCWFTAGDSVYTLNQNNCPAVRKVARMIAERKGIVPTATRAATA
jgi:hypothetical protein